MAGADAVGGSLELGRLIDQAGEELLFDFRHYLGLDLLDVLRDGSGLTPRLAIAYIRQLPVESAFVARMRGGAEFRGWNQDRYMLADLIDLSQWQIFAQVSANSKKKPKKPDAYERPEVRRQKKTNPNSFAMQAAMRLAAAKNRKAQDG